MSVEEQKTSLFPDISGENDDSPVTEIESLCMNCHQNGMTRLMLTAIPYYREVIISSFSCDHCGYEDRQIQSGGKIQDKGVQFELHVKTKQDMNRQIVKSDYATFSIPSLQFEQPSTRKGTMTTVEGLVSMVIEGLQQEQPQRRLLNAEVAQQIDNFIQKLEELKSLQTDFKIVIDDPSGNSFIENPEAPKPDPSCKMTRYRRNAAQNEAIGEPVEDVEPEPETDGEIVAKDEVISFKINCPQCNSPGTTKMKMVDIPFFKEVVIMATNCDVCGYRENEVKGGSGIEDKGTKLTLRLTDPSDLTRDVLKSDTSALEIPELDLSLEHGTLGGRFTTIEGLLINIKDQLTGKNSFTMGDSAQGDRKTKMMEFCDKLGKIISGETLNVHFILDDPAGNSYIQNVYAPDPDPEMTIEHYERNEEQKEILGLNDMKVENYC